MADIADVVCAFCGSIMGLSREMPASSETHALRFFSCDTCGASDLRIDRESGIRISGIRISGIGDQDS